MKAVIAKKPGGPEVLQLVDIDQPLLEEGEVRIQVALRRFKWVEHIGY